MVESSEVAEKFIDGFDCAQVVFEHYADQFGLDSDIAKKIASGFGGGSMRGETCGAIIGAYMAIGLMFGISKGGEDGQAQKVESLKKIEEFNRAFTDKYEHFECRELMGADISTPEGMKIIQEKNLMMTFCPKLVCDVTKILDEIL